VKEVMTLRLRDELSYPEIAAVMGISRKTVEAQMAAALRHVRVALRDLQEPPE
jgi:DNA-directed RNA polymerase specialized sigma24 family protein